MTPLTAPDLDTLRLSIGSHPKTSDELCVMEAVAYAAGEEKTDHPDSASVVIGQFLTALNDSASEVNRQLLKRLIPMLPGSRGDDQVETARSWMVMDWHCRTWPSVWLRAAGCVEAASELENAAPITDPETLSSALPALRNAVGAAVARRLDTINDSMEESLASAIAAVEADEQEPALAAAFASIRSGDTSPLATARDDAPAALGWDAARRARWSKEWDGGVYTMALVLQTTQIAAVRALYTSSAWSGSWNIARVGVEEKWELALDDARVAGRDAALSIALPVAWAAATHADQTAQWQSAMDAAVAALEKPARALQDAAIDFVAAMAGEGGLHVGR